MEAVLETHVCEQLVWLLSGAALVSYWNSFTATHGVLVDSIGIKQ